MQPQKPLYQRLYLDGSSQPSVLTSTAVLSALNIEVFEADFFSFTRSERAAGMPRHFYKYRSLNLNDHGSIDKARSLIVKEEVWFAQVSTFNDAMEMEFGITLPNSEETMSRAVDELSHLLKTQKWSPAKRLLVMQKMRGMSPQLRLDAEKKLREGIDRSLGIYCVSVDPRNQLLWAHYADKSTGFCVQFATYNDPIFVLGSEVMYTDQTAVLEILKHGEERVPHYLYKTTAWAYEKEWRLAILGVQGPLRLRRNSVVGVIFGAKASKDTIRTILAMDEERKQRGLNPLNAYKAEVVRGTPSFRVVRL